MQPSNTTLTDPLSVTIKSGNVLMRDIAEKATAIARLDKHLLLIGEMSVGKKRLARHIHDLSGRAGEPFETFYCVDIDEGRFKDAFGEQIYLSKGHINLRYELLEKAGKGTLFIDQFGELNSTFMGGILDSYHSGCNQLFRYNPNDAPRLILSVNQHSYSTLIRKETWINLLHQLDPVALMIPPLRERPEDISTIISQILLEIKDSNSGYEKLKISDEALSLCLSYRWPGNIRQMKNAIIQGAVLSSGQEILPCHLPFSMNWELPYQHKNLMHHNHLINRTPTSC
jgi:DNA-binding NtrC family response regulator